MSPAPVAGGEGVSGGDAGYRSVVPNVPDTTLEGLEGQTHQDVVGARWRRAFLVVLAVVVAAGAAGLLGVRDASTAAAEDGLVREPALRRVRSSRARRPVHRDRAPPGRLRPRPSPWP